MKDLFNNRGEGYINTGVKIIIAVVIGALILGGLYLLFTGEDGVMGKLNDEIEGMMDYGAEVSAVRVNNDSKYLKDLQITYNGRDWVEPNIPSYDEDAEIMKFVSQSQTFCATVKDSEGVYLISSTDGGKTWEQRRAWSTAVIKTNLYWDEATGMFKGSYETQSLLQCIKSRDGINWTSDGMPYAKL